MPAKKSSPLRPSANAVAKIYAVIRRIPEGKVATYGQIAALAGLPRRARMVGAALRNSPEGLSLPWQRVINAGGTISSRGGLGMEEGFQRHLLEEEGIRFDEHGRIDLERYRWDPEGAGPRRAGRSAREALTPRPPSPKRPAKSSRAYPPKPSPPRPSSPKGRGGRKTS